MISVAFPCPFHPQSQTNHTRVWSRSVHTRFDGAVHLRHYFRLGTLAAARTGRVLSGKRAVGDVLGGRDGKHSRQSRNLPEKIRESIGHPIPYGGVAGAHGDQPPGRYPGYLRPLLEEVRRHTTRFVHVQVHPDAVTLCTSDHATQIGQSPLVIDTELGEVRTAWRQLPQHDMEPHSVDTDVSQGGQAALREKDLPPGPARDRQTVQRRSRENANRAFFDQARSDPVAGLCPGG